MRFGLLLVENYLAYARVTQDHYLEQHPSDDEKSYGGSRTSSTNNTLKGDSNSCQGAGSTSTLRAAKPMAPIFCLGPTFGCQTRLVAAISAEAPLASRTELC